MEGGNMANGRSCTGCSKLKICHYTQSRTHLLGLEEPPVHPNWRWAGCNRESGSRKGGGIGVLWCNGIDGNWKKLEGSCKEHMWMMGDILDMPVLVAVLYFSVDPGQNAENRCIAQRIAEDIQRWGFNREVLIMGHFNGHVQSIDGLQDHNGELMLQLADTFSLEVANLCPDCIGDGTALPQALGFLDAQGNRCSKSVRTTKVRLEVRWKDTKRTRLAPEVCDL
ncbi:hypothetical protein HPB50_007330 [Hyalomma asiaticum]|uniref:Uncharacterized protein n=1 Tax=Hyalomma asiaticum TaxID=266040 RepID=A0ACB7TG91_HYAAI|nr:hypothetical protein HPB50_007330 [Hyalomma asiaticum]